MAETNKAWSTIQSELADNSAKEIAASEMRDALYSLSQIAGGLYVTAGTAVNNLNGTTWVQLDLADFTNDAASVGVSPDKASDRIVLPAVAGVYLITAWLSYTCNTATQNYGLKLQLDGADIAGAQSSVRIITANTPSPSFLVAPFVFTPGAGVITLWGNCTSGTPTMVLTDGGIWVRRLG